MASPADAVAYAASGGWDEQTNMQVVAWLRGDGPPPDQLTPQAAQAIQDIGGMGLSGLGVDQLDTYLSTGTPPPDLSYVDESAQVLGGATPDVPTAQQAPDAPAATSGGPTTEQQSAKAILDDVLGSYGLSGLGDSLWQQYLAGAPLEVIMQNLRKTPEYQARFPGMAALQQKGHAISEQQYIDLERSYSAIYHAAGLPSGFYDSPDDFGKLIAGEVSPTEVKSRVDLAVQAAQAPNETHAELQRLYGVNTGNLAAFYLDPDKALPLLQQQYQAAGVAGAADRTGFGSINAGQAERIAALGVSADQAQQGFSTLAGAKELFRPLDAGEQAIGQDAQLGAAFEGNAAARQAIEERRRRRLAQFQAGGAYAASQQGVTGLGSAAS